MQIIDAQIHVWGSGLPSNPSHLQVTLFTTDEAARMMDEASVHDAVIHPPSWDPGADGMAFEAVKIYPARFAIMGALPLDAPNAPDRIKTWRQRPGMLRLRYVFLHDPARQRLVDDDLEHLWEACERASVPIPVLANDTLGHFARIVECHPGLRIAIDHLGGRGGLTTLKDHEAMEHMPTLVQLARLPNVAVKATGAPGYSSEDYSFPIMQSYLRQICDAFGPKRMFWGADISKIPCSWQCCVTMFTEELDWLNKQDKQLVMGDAICKWWGWQR